MLDWENLHFFIAVAQTGSLSGAARRLKVDHATVGRRLTALESQLGARLVDRLPRSCQLTALGQQVFELAGSIEDSAFSIERLVQGQQAPMQGSVVISAPPVLAHNLLAPHLFTFAQPHPGIRIAIASQVQTVSLQRREADIALRLFRPEEPRNVTRKIATMAYALYASRDYAHADTPEQWGFIGYEPQYQELMHPKWLHSLVQGRRIVCEAPDISMHQVLARTGIGIASLPVFMGDNDPQLQRLPMEGAHLERDIWLVVHPDLQRSPMIRAVIDFLVDLADKTFSKASRE